MNLLMTSEFGKTQKFFHGKSFFQLLWHKLGQGDTISQKAELFLNAMAWKRISLRGAKFSHDCLFVHQCSLAELPISNFTMLLATVLLCHDHWGVLLSLWAAMNISIWMLISYKQDYEFPKITKKPSWCHQIRTSNTHCILIQHLDFHFLGT